MSKKKTKIYYYDSFTNEVVTKKESSAPERYLEIYDLNSEGYYTDTYTIYHELVYKYRCSLHFNFSYSVENSWKKDYTFWYNSLKAYVENIPNNPLPDRITMNQIHLIRRGYPSSEFKKILKENK